MSLQRASPSFVIASGEATKQSHRYPTTKIAMPSARNDKKGNGVTNHMNEYISCHLGKIVIQYKHR